MKKKYLFLVEILTSFALFTTLASLLFSTLFFYFNNERQFQEYKNATLNHIFIKKRLQSYLEHMPYNITKNHSKNRASYFDETAYFFEKKTSIEGEHLFFISKIPSQATLTIQPHLCHLFVSSNTLYMAFCPLSSIKTEAFDYEILATSVETFKMHKTGLKTHISFEINFQNGNVTSFVVPIASSHLIWEF